MKRPAFLLLIAALAAAFFLLAPRRGGRLFQGAPSEDDLPPSRPATRVAVSAPPRAPRPAESAPPARATVEARLARAEQALSLYLTSTRYPPDSRPLREQPDMDRPHHVAERKLPLARKDHKLTDATVTLRQDRLYLVGDDHATLSVTCTTSEGPAHCEISSASAFVPPAERDADKWPKVPVSFTEGGEGAFLADLAPKAMGFSGYHGIVHVELSVGIEGESGGAGFDVIVTPAAPALLTGKVREAMESGSLVFYVELDVLTAGRFVIDGRVDAGGRSLALLSFNEELATGKQEIKLPLFGKIVHDEGVEGVFHLRDLEGFRLIEDAHPDRETIPALEGEVFASRPHRASEFSADEWSSDERSRHVEALQGDVSAAKAELAGMR